MEEKKKYIGIEISKTNNVMSRKYCNSEYADRIDEMTGKNGWIIGYLAENDGKEIFQRDIEEHFSIRRSTVSSMIQLMEKKGFIIRESVGYDARLKKLVLTPKAKEIHCKMIAALEENEKMLKADIPENELEVFFSVLERIRNNAEEQEEK